MRIIGGIYRSRRLRVPTGTSTRPTTDRVREALFGILEAADAIHGARALDLYAGTGALALEALSRGAAAAVLVESSRSALSVLRANIQDLGLHERAFVMAADVESIASRLAADGPFDLVFADPPWKGIHVDKASHALSALALGGGLSSRALVVLEHAARSSPPTVAGLTLADTRRYGDTALAIYKPAIIVPSHREPAGTTSE